MTSGCKGIRVKLSSKLPDVPLDMPVAILVYCSYYSEIYKDGSFVTVNHSISKFKPQEGTEWHEVTSTGFKSLYNSYSSSTFEFGWPNNISSWEVYNSRQKFSYRVGYRHGITIGEYWPATAHDTVTAPPYQLWPELRFWGMSRAKADYGSHWLYIGTLRQLTDTFREIPDALDYWSSWSNSGYILTRELICVPWLVDKNPPLQGQSPPPMKDCCAEIRAELRRLRKELKEVQDVFDPKGFKETILPIEYDKDGKIIERNSTKAITVPDAIKALGKTSSIMLPTEYFRIPTGWLPRSWFKGSPDNYEQIREQELPEEKTIPLPLAIKWMYEQLYKANYTLDPEGLRFSSIPARFVKPGSGVGEKAKADNLPQFIKLIFQAIDNYGFHPFAVKTEDTNLSEPGKQSEHTRFLSLGAALQHIIKYTNDMEAESDAQLELLVRLAYEAGLIHQISADNQQKLQNVQDFLGFEIVKEKDTLKMAFNPLAGSN